ncbi:MAG: PqqD family protein [Solirubrobacteraceae bacterium]|nr:PqqD family protein [Solirubrobacteraceae bacterium]
MLHRVDVDQVHWRRAGDDLLVLHLPSSRYLQLNASAGVLWEAVVEGATTEDLEGRLVDAYGIEAEQASSDVAGFLQSLRDGGLLHAAP